MAPFNIVIPPSGAVAVADFAAEADKALEAYREAFSDKVPADQMDQLRLVLESAKKLVAAGVAGDQGVYAVLGGNANPGHHREPGQVESLVSIGIYQRPAPLIPEKAGAEKARKRGGSNG